MIVVFCYDYDGGVVFFVFFYYYNFMGKFDKFGCNVFIVVVFYDVEGYFDNF